MTLGDHVTIFFRSPSLEQSLCGIVHHFSHGNILVTWKLEEVTSECVGYVLNVGHLAALSQGRLEHLSWRMFLARTLNERWHFWHLDRVWCFLPRHQKQNQWRRQWPPATDLQLNCSLLIEQLLIYVWRIPCTRWMTVRHIEHEFSAFGRISSRGKKTQFATTGNVAIWNLRSCGFD